MSDYVRRRRLPPMNVPLEEIDHCVVCFMADVVLNDTDYLSRRLNSRLEWVDHPLPDIEMVDPVSSPADANVVEEDNNSEDEHVPSPSNENLEEEEEETINYEPLVDESVNLNACILPQLRAFFVLKHVFQHPLDHPTTEKMMLLVQSPSDWFYICGHCVGSIDVGITQIQNMKRIADDDEMKETYIRILVEKVRELQQKFVDSYLALVPPECWEFDENTRMLENGDVAGSNFLLSEAEAVWEFRRFLHHTGFARLQQTINPTQEPEPVPMAEPMFFESRENVQFAHNFEFIPQQDYEPFPVHNVGPFVPQIFGHFPIQHFGPFPLPNFGHFLPQNFGHFPQQNWEPFVLENDEPSSPENVQEFLQENYEPLSPENGQPIGQENDEAPLPGDYEPISPENDEHIYQQNEELYPLENYEALSPENDEPIPPENDEPPHENLVTPDNSDVASSENFDSLDGYGLEVSPNNESVNDLNLFFGSPENSNGEHALIEQQEEEEVAQLPPIDPIVEDVLNENFGEDFPHQEQEEEQQEANEELPEQDLSSILTMTMKL